MKVMETGLGCGYIDEQGRSLTDCEDKPVITYCKKCNTVYAINQDTGDATELSMTIEELLQFIARSEKKEN